MIYKELLRNLILGSPILSITATALVSFLILAFKYSLSFKIFIFIIFLYDVILLLTLKKIVRKNFILFGYGILLTMCGLTLHRIYLIQQYNFPEETLHKIFGLKSLITTNFKKSSFSKFEHNLELMSPKVSNLKLYKIVPSNKQIQNTNSDNNEEIAYNISPNSSTQLNQQPQIVHKTQTVHLIKPDRSRQINENLYKKNKIDFSKQLNHEIVQPVKLKLINESFDEKQKEGKSQNYTYDENMNKNKSKLNNRETIVDEKQTNLLLKYRSILIYQNNIIKQFKKLSENLNGLHTIVNDNLKTFDKEFYEFYKMSKNIESEMIAFNASPKFFKSVLQNLHSEIDKFFSFKYSPIVNSESITKYIESILNSKKIEDTMVLKNSKHKILMIIVKFKYFYAIISAFIILFFILFFLNLQNYELFFKMFIVACLFVLSITSVVVLAYVQILDRDCKLGKIEGCKKYLTNDILEFNRSGAFHDAENFDNNLTQYLLNLKEQLHHLSNKFKDLITEKVNLKILVFKNLFDKINFVREEFKNITKNKVNEEVFYNHIKEMYDILDKFTSILTDDIKFTINEIFIESISNFTFLKLNKSIVIRKIKHYAYNRQKKINKSMSTKCGTLLDKLCLSKEYLEEIFNMHVFFCLFIFILLLL